VSAPVDRPVDPFDARFAARASRAVGEAAATRDLDSSDLQVATTLARLSGEEREDLMLATAQLVRAARTGSVAVALTDLTGLGPDPAAALATSPLLASGGPLRLDRDLVYLDRYWRLEEQVVSELLQRISRPAPTVDQEQLTATLDRVFADADDPVQRRAAVAAVNSSLSIITGGPGTGKTSTVAKVLACVLDQPGPAPRIALAAPTGKAAAQLTSAVAAELAGGPAGATAAEWEAVTVHRLLGSRPDNRQRFRYNRDQRLSYDVIVVDETSMLSLTLMARLLEAVRPDARLILLGDADQLASVEAGAVLADVVAGLQDRAQRGIEPVAAVVRLTHSWRFGAVPALAELAGAVRDGDADQALAVLRSGCPEVRLAGAVDAAADAVMVHAALALRRAGEDGDPTVALDLLDRHRVICAHREGAFGVGHFNTRIDERTTAAWQEQPVGPRYFAGDAVPGHPLVATANDYGIGVFNGDQGVLVRERVTDGPSDESVVTAVFRRGDRVIRVSPHRLAAAASSYAVTVHRSQGSQFDEVTVVLPPAESPVLTRELLYTAVTRARHGLTVIGSEEALRAGIARPAGRASGLRRRLAEG